MSADLRQLDSIELVALCVSDTQSTAPWFEFVRRFGPKIRLFVRSTLWQSAGSAGSPVFAASVQASDLFQDTIIRLVENDCAALKRFTGASESDLLAYLAVVSRSVVRDHLRHYGAGKRADFPMPWSKPARRFTPTGLQLMEKEILAREVMCLSHRTARALYGESGKRDWLIFQLYYHNGLSAQQIARCKGIDLSIAGVEKVLNRLKERVRSLVAADRSEAVIQ